ncbi:MAG TPA: hypothetical protein DCY13_24410 [Verrucomicrobiales bacterium]|nr:hypothetical protein [Verrucomicrobiales bacterium]
MKLLIKRLAGWSEVVGRLSIVMIVIASGFLCAGENFTAEGRGEARLFERGELRETQTAMFSVAASGTNWFIHVQQTGSSRAQERAVSLDYRSFPMGLNVVTLGYFDKGTLERMHSDFAGHELHGMAWVERTVVPRGDSSIWISPLWYALCSSVYLENHGEGPVEPPYNLDGDLEYFQKGRTNVLARWRLVDAATGLPEVITFLHSGVWRDHLGQERRLPEPWSDGFTNATLRAVWDTNTAGSYQPVSFHFEVAQPESISGRPDVLRSMLTVEFQVERFERVASIPDPPVRLSGNFTFTDRRFMHPGFEVARLNYVTNRVLSDEEVTALPQFAHRQQQFLAASGRRGPTLGIRLAFIGILLVSAAGLFWLLRRSRNSTASPS